MTDLFGFGQEAGREGHDRRDSQQRRFALLLLVRAIWLIGCELVFVFFRYCVREEITLCVFAVYVCLIYTPFDLPLLRDYSTIPDRRSKLLKKIIYIYIQDYIYIYIFFFPLKGCIFGPIMEYLI